MICGGLDRVRLAGRGRWPAASSRTGTPAVNVGGPEPARSGRDASGAAMSMPRPQPVRSVAVRQSSNLNTLEASTPGLQRALLLLAIAPITQHYLDVAAAYRQAGVWDKAFDFLTEGLRHDPADASLHDTLARAWRDWGFPDRGLTAAHRAVYHAPRSAEARNTLGTVLWALGQRADARQAFEAGGGTRPAGRLRLAQPLSRRRWPTAGPGGDLGLPAGRGVGAQTRRRGTSMKAESLDRRRGLMPPAPRTLDESGLTFDQVLQLVIKLLHVAGDLSGAELGERLGLRYSVLEPVLQHLRTSYLCEVLGRRAGRRSVVHLSRHRRRPRQGDAVPRAEPLRRRGAGAVPPVRACTCGRSTNSRRRGG